MNNWVVERHEDRWLMVNGSVGGSEAAGLAVVGLVWT